MNFGFLPDIPYPYIWNFQWVHCIHCFVQPRSRPTSTQRPNTNRSASIEDLRNAGTPFWCNVQFSISAMNERALRQRLWETVGYDKADQNWWIAWVPEAGHFEIDVPEDYDIAALQQFWQVAPERYRYTVMSVNGTILMKC